jgi:hypothetical protein
MSFQAWIFSRRLLIADTLCGGASAAHRGHVDEVQPDAL